MKFEINKKLFIEGLNKAIGAVSTKAPLPILSGVLLSVNGEGLTIIGSNGDITVRTYIPTKESEKVTLQNIEPGSVVLQAKLLNNILKKLPKDIVSVKMDDGFRVVINSGKSKFKLNGMDATEYPNIPSTTDSNSFEIGANLLKDVINQTVFAVSHWEGRPILTGVHVEKELEQLKFVSTDSHRLSQILIDTSASDDFNTTIPGGSLKELNKILPATEETVSISMNSNLIAFEFGHTLFLTKVLDGNFPETNRLIPNTESTIVKVSNKELTSCLERASVLSDNPIVKFTIDGGIIAKLESNTAEVGNVFEEVILEDFEGDDLCLSFSAKYALEALNAIKEENIVVTLNGAMRPFTFKAEGNESILQLVLPVRTY